MIIAIDIGGTKTLVALFDSKEKPVQEYRFETPKKYPDFLKELAKIIEKIPAKDRTITAVAAPGKIDREKGVGIAFGNLPWKNVAIAHDIGLITNTPTLVDNDANLAGLSEAYRLEKLPHRAIYLTFSTGIGSGIITDGYIDPDMADSEAGEMLFEHDNHLMRWEEFASGKAIVNKYEKLAADINDPKVWKEITRNFAIGIIDISSVLEPDVIIVGGSVGSYFLKYDKYLNDNLKDLRPRLVEIPKIVQAQAPEEAVIYGCAILARQYTDEQHR